MKNKNLTITINIAVISLILLTNIAMAVQIPGRAIDAPERTKSITGWEQILGDIFYWVYTAFFIIAALFIILAAFTYLTAQGDPEKVGKAKDRIVYAVVAIVVALIAVGIDVFIESFLSSGE